MRVHVTRDQVVAAFADANDEGSFSESRKLLERGGLPVEMLQAMSLRPEILKGFAGFSHGVYPGGLLERSLKERVILESSRINECQFCTTTHIAIMQMERISDEPLASLDDHSVLSDREKLALAYTRAAMRDSNHVPDSLFDELKRAFTEPEIVELTFLIGFINMLNMFNNCLQVTYRDDFAALLS